MVHEADAIGQETTNKTRSSSCGVEEGDTKSERLSAVEHGKVQDDTGEETGLGQAENKTAGNESTKVLNEGAKGGDETPGDGQTGEVPCGMETLDNHVRRSFEQLWVQNSQSCGKREGGVHWALSTTEGKMRSETYTVGDEKQRDGQLELIALELQVSLETEQASISDVDWTGEKKKKSAWPSEEGVDYGFL